MLLGINVMREVASAVARPFRTFNPVGRFGIPVRDIPYSDEKLSRLTSALFDRLADRRARLLCLPVGKRLERGIGGLAVCHTCRGAQCNPDLEEYQRTSGRRRQCLASRRLL